MTSRPTTHPRRLTRWLALPLLLTGVLLGVAPAPPAGAHPFGDPQTLDVAPTADGVSVRWRAAEDDLTSLALRLDLLEGPRSYVYRDGAMVPEQTGTDDAERLALAPELETYLLSRIEVLADGAPCAGALVTAEDLAADGALLEYACASTPAEVEVRARTLTDLHAAYRTLATGPGGATHLYGTEAESHVFRLAGSVDGPTVAGSGLTLVGWAGAGAGVLLVAGLGARRLRRLAS